MRNPDVAGVHNENDLQMLTRVAERTGTCRSPRRAISAQLTMRTPQSSMIFPCLVKNPAKSERSFLSEPVFAHTFKISDLKLRSFI